MRLVPWTGLPVALLALALMTASAPTASAEINFEDVRVDLGPERIDAQLMGHRIEGDDARDLRAVIDDDYGDGDGEVSQAELDSFVEEQKDGYNDQLNGVGGAIFFGPFQVREKQSHTREITNMSFSDSVLGDVEDSSTIRQDIEAALLFFSTDSSRVTISFEEDFSVPFSQVDMRWGTATFQTASGWQIDPESVDPDGKENTFLQDGRFVVPYDQSGEFSSSDQPLVFDIVDTGKEPLGKDSKDSPTPAVALLVGMLLVGLLVGRRSLRE